MRLSRVGYILAVGVLAIETAYAQQPPKELIQYIRDARKAGLNEAEIQQNAVNAGWPQDFVKSAVSASRERPESAETRQTTRPPAETANDQRPARPKDTPAESAPVPSRSEAPAAASGGAGERAGPRAPDRGVPDDYVIGEGDVLHISVWKEPDASVPNVVVRPDGKISMPMLKEVQVSGLTPAQAERLISEQLAKFISAADVTVIVSGINSKKIYVVGGVKREGPIPYTYRMTILQAISEAGGLTDYAKKKRIYVLRREGGRDFQLRFDYDAALRGEHMELNIPLLPGDTLVVPK